MTKNSIFFYKHRLSLFSIIFLVLIGITIASGILPINKAEAVTPHVNAVYDNQLVSIRINYPSSWTKTTGGYPRGDLVVQFDGITQDADPYVNGDFIDVHISMITKDTLNNLGIRSSQQLVGFLEGQDNGLESCSDKNGNHVNVCRGTDTFNGSPADYVIYYSTNCDVAIHITGNANDCYQSKVLRYASIIDGKGYLFSYTLGPQQHLTVEIPEPLFPDVFTMYLPTINEMIRSFAVFHNTNPTTPPNGPNNPTQPPTGPSAPSEPVNAPPFANAGRHQDVRAGQRVILDGSASYDPENEPMRFSWSQVSGNPHVSLSNPYIAKPSFTAPNVKISTLLSFQLIVRDSKAASSRSIATVTIQPTLISGIVQCDPNNPDICTLQQAQQGQPKGTTGSSASNSFQPQSQVPSATKKSFFIVFRGTTTKSTPDSNIGASTSGSFSLIMDSTKLVSGDNIGTAAGSGRVQIKITDTEGCKYEYKGAYKIHGKLTYDTYFTTGSPEGRIRAVTNAQPELTTTYDPTSEKDIIFAPNVGGPSSCRDSYSSGFSPMLWCNEGAADLDLRLGIATTKFQRSGENQECIFSLGNKVQNH